MTTDVYAHAREGSQRELASTLDQLYGGCPCPNPSRPPVSPGLSSTPREA